YMQSLEFPFTF
nr:immunoglobulin light chain junction region [Macaca mulatta]